MVGVAGVAAAGGVVTDVAAGSVVRGVAAGIAAAGVAAAGNETTDFPSRQSSGALQVVHPRRRTCSAGI